LELAIWNGGDRPAFETIDETMKVAVVGAPTGLLDR
jgi:hypothetical protein